MVNGLMMKPNPRQSNQPHNPAVAPPNLNTYPGDPGPKPRPSPSHVPSAAQRPPGIATQRSNSSGKIVPPPLSNIGGSVKPESTAVQVRERNKRLRFCSQEV